MDLGARSVCAEPRERNIRQVTMLTTLPGHPAFVIPAADCDCERICLATVVALNAEVIAVFCVWISQRATVIDAVI